jgi:2-dehydropantoate 2-reductase
MEPKILIVGAGAVGSYYGARLAQAGAEVSALLRSDYDAVIRNGIQIKSIDGDLHFTPKEVINDISLYRDIPDYIIVATKVLPEIDVPALIQKKISGETSIVLLQNGIDIELPVAAAFPENEIISALAFICVSRIGPGIVDHQDYGRIVIGKYPGGSSRKTELLARLFSKSGVACERDPDIIAARWKKLLWNAPFNPISVLGGGIDTRDIMESEAALLLVRNVMREVVNLSEKAGHRVHESLIEKNIEDTRTMTPYKTSMLLDYENKRPMEVEAILGNAVKSAVRHGVSVPAIQALYALLKLVDEKNRY